MARNTPAAAAELPVTKKPRTARTEPRKVSVLLRLVDDDGHTVPLPAGVQIKLLTVSSDARKILAALRGDRNLIELEYTYPAAEVAVAAVPATVHQLADAAE